MRNDLPETCFATLPGMGDLIIIKRGETGYYPSDWETGDKVENQKIADFHNQKRGITPAQVEAMLVGSMSDFDAPGANPQIEFMRGEFMGTLQQISHHALSVCFTPHTSGDLHVEIRMPYFVAAQGPENPPEQT